MRLKQEALTFAREQRADYILFVDTDSILTNNQTLKFLMAQNKSVVAPMLDSQTYYSNFWCGITPQGYYRRTADYFPTKNRQRVGCFAVPMVYATFLIDLRKEETSQLAFYPPHPNYTWSFDDIIVFAYSCQAAGVEAHVCNQQRFGYINVPVKAHQTLEDERVNFVHLTLEAMVDGPPMQRSSHISLPPKPLTKMGFDEIFLINLVRRPDRRQRMLASLRGLEIAPRGGGAVGGRALRWGLLSWACSAFRSEDYKRHFAPRDLLVYSAHPLLVYPTHYAGDTNWLSDTETSTIWDDDSKKTGWNGSQKTLKDPRGGVGHSLRSAAREQVEELKLQNEELQAKITLLNEQLKKEEEKHEAIVKSLEQKAMVDKESLMKEMEQRVEALATETHRRMSETTQQVIQENVALRAQLGRLHSYNRDLLKDNEQLQATTRDLKIQVDLLEDREKEMAKRLVCNRKMISTLTTLCEMLQGLGDEMEWKKVQSQLEQLKEAAALLRCEEEDSRATVRKMPPEQQHQPRTSRESILSKGRISSRDLRERPLEKTGKSHWAKLRSRLLTQELSESPAAGLLLASKKSKTQELGAPKTSSSQLHSVLSSRAFPELSNKVPVKMQLLVSHLRPTLGGSGRFYRLPLLEPPVPLLQPGAHDETASP
ncbi:PREDICTED: uncharacterized protein LOC104565433 [Tinamus guttatus]|uniref:uncharacterized protein LOC104565433 n=1 Tax=Tinamus guttatus TaxID=94827 RepID=UPI00052EE64F|nr:PREDICTED: uncharacterized protein LOC104565433 [Tinamus guttatus]